MSRSEARLPERPVQPMRLAAFNHLGRDRAVNLVRACFDVPRWWSAVVDLRPYPHLEELLEVARDAAYPLTGPELELALAQHLRSRPAQRMSYPVELGGNARAAQRLAEESKIRWDAELDQYKARFGRPFIIRTAGRSSQEIAEQLTARLSNDADTEDQLIANQLRQIALLDLTSRVSDY